MVFIMRVLGSAKALTLLLAVGLLPWPGFAAESDILIEKARIFEKEQSYALDADITYHLTPKVLKTVQNGIPLQWVLRVQLYRLRPYLWNECVVDVLQRYRIRYHALMNTYQVLDEDRGEANYFSTLPAALEAFGTIRDVPLPGLQLLHKDNRYVARIKMQLDREALPLPLRPIAYINSDWYLSSDWYSWPLQK